MKFLVNTTVFSYFSQVQPNFLARVGASTIKEVAGELGYLIGEGESNEMLAGVEVVKSHRSGKEVQHSRWLSETDKTLLSTAEFIGAELVSDDKKLIAAAREIACKATHTPGFVEALAQKIEKNEALEILEKLRPKYLRRKLVDSAIERVRRW